MTHRRFRITGPVALSLVSLATAPALAQVLPPVLTKSFLVSTIPLNGTTTLTFTSTNPNTTLGSGGDLSGVSFTDNLPAGLVVATPSNAVGFGLSAVEGATSVSVSGGFVQANSTFVYQVDVTGTTPGVKINTTSAVSTDQSDPGAPASATLTVLAPVVSTTTRPAYAVMALLIAASGFLLVSRSRA